VAESSIVPGEFFGVPEVPERAAAKGAPMFRIAPARALFVGVAALSLAALIASVACTRRGGGGSPTPPTNAPTTTYYVNPAKGSDSGNGSQTAPFKTLTKALSVVKGSTVTGLTISLAAGTYSTASGEVFPIVVPTGVVLAGNNYGRKASKGTFINGFGEDTALEKAWGKPAHTLFTTIEIPSGVTGVTADQLYVGAGRLSIPSNAHYASVDVLGSLGATQDTFGAATFTAAAAGGIIVPSGTLDCTACVIGGFDYGIEAFTLPSASSAPTLLLGGPGQSAIGGGDGIRTDGTANITASSEVFQSRSSAYTDSLVVASGGLRRVRPAATASPSTSPSSSPTSGPAGPTSIDFGYGGTGSLGGNTFIGSRTEINVTQPGAKVFARNDTWNALAQGTSKHGQYTAARTFVAGASGRNVTIASAATGSAVIVGPASPPSPSPTPTAYGSPTPSPTASPT
jgi:hypothetical protein